MPLVEKHQQCSVALQEEAAAQASAKQLKLEQQAASSRVEQAYSRVWELHSQVGPICSALQRMEAYIAALPLYDVGDDSELQQPALVAVKLMREGVSCLPPLAGFWYVLCRSSSQLCMDSAMLATHALALAQVLDLCSPLRSTQGDLNLGQVWRPLQSIQHALQLVVTIWGKVMAACWVGAQFLTFLGSTPGCMRDAP